jgi:hypothetical protein
MYGDGWIISGQPWLGSHFPNPDLVGVDVPSGQRKYLDEALHTSQPVSRALHLFPSRFFGACGSLVVSYNFSNVRTHQMGYDLPKGSI